MLRSFQSANPAWGNCRVTSALHFVGKLVKINLDYMRWVGSTTYFDPVVVDSTIGHLHLPIALIEIQWLALYLVFDSKERKTYMYVFQ